MGRVYVVEVDETKPATRLIDASTSAAAGAFVSKQIISVRLATQTDMFDAAKNGLEIEDSAAPAPEPTGVAGQAKP